MMLSPLICTPCYTERPTAIYVTSIVRLSPVPDLFMPSQCSLAAARARSVMRFMDGEWSHLFFIDDDIGFAPQTFRRVLTAGFDVTAAAAPFRSDDQPGFTVDRKDISAVHDGFAEVMRIGAGFMCIKREVIDTMCKHYSTPELFALSLPDSGNLPQSMVEEDHSFCQRWQAIGGKVHIDVTAELAHQGTKVFRRDFGAYLKGEQTRRDLHSQPVGGESPLG